MKNYIQFINHASLLISNGNKSLLTDPWYSGSVFDDGWSLLFENSYEKIQKLLNQVNYIWVSHEHPDHFSIKFLSDYENILKEKKIKFVFQKTRDKRVILFLKTKGFEFIELENNKSFIVDENFSLKIQQCDFYDSALILEIGDKKIFNLNDCPLKTRSQIENFKKRYGECDFLFTQFSYAAWKGGKNNLNWRKSAAEEKIQTLKYQSEIFNSKYTIPFASFIKFCDNYNFYLNDSVNTPARILEECRDINSKILFLKPYQIINLDNTQKENTGYEFWNKIYNDKNNFNIIENIKKYDFKSLSYAFEIYKKRIFSKNSKILIKLISRFKVFNFFQPIIIKLRDLNISIKLDLANDIFEEVHSKPNIEMYSKSLYLIFNQDFGFDTLTVNGCFEEKTKNSFLKLSKNFAIGNLNNLGINLDLRIIFNISLILLYLRKLKYVKKYLHKISVY